MQALAEKIALGTVQFGQKYGISNQTGQVARSEVAGILQTAAASGITTLDTAAAYGESELVLGEALSISDHRFQVVTKLPNVAPAEVEHTFRQSLKKLGLQNLYGYLVHDFGWFQQNPGIWAELQKLKEKQQVQKVGFSLYEPGQAVWLLENGFVPDLVQVPYNLFDQRFTTVISGLKSSGTEVHARSVFLQGLFFLHPENLPRHFAPVKEKLASVRALFSANQIPVEAGLLGFAWLCESLDKLVIGVESAQQLAQNLHAEKYLEKLRALRPVLQQFEETNPAILLPTNWK